MDFERKEMADMYPPNTWRGHRAEELKRFRPFNKEASSWKGFSYFTKEDDSDDVVTIDPMQDQ